MNNKAVSFFSLFCGIAMLIVWSFLILSSKVVELRTTPLEAISLICAEFLTAVLLVLGGSGVLSRKSWGLRTELIALGALLYCAAYSIGVFGQGGNVPAAGFFVVIFILTVIFCSRFVIESIKGGSQ